jgi:hypothetical protein
MGKREEENIVERTCQFCGEARPWKMVSKRIFDFSAMYELPEGTVTKTVYYCNDRPECEEKLKSVRPDTGSIVNF